MLISSPDHDDHLLGQHTVRMSPISTAQLHLDSRSFCLASPGDTVLIPVLLNNSQPTSIRYSLTPLGADTSGHGMTKSTFLKPKADVVDLSARELKAIESARVEALQSTRLSTPREADDDDEYDDDDDEAEDINEDARSSHSWLQKTQSISYIRVTKPGILRLERVAHASGVDARLVYPIEVTIAPCPTAEFVDDARRLSDTIRCAGDNPDLDLKIRIFGVPPLSLRWHRETNGKTDPFLVEGIQGDHEESRGMTTAPKIIDVPLTVSVEALGEHVYNLGSVTDGLGNHVTLDSSASSYSQSRLSSGTGVKADSKLRRSMTVLRRPTVSFRKCAPNNPTSMLIGSETSIPILNREADDLDAPWEIKVDFTPSGGTGKNAKPWTKTIATQDTRHNAELLVQDAGTYTIKGVKGRYCDGDVMNPDVCPVVELPKPTAEIEWRRIHEWQASSLRTLSHLNCCTVPETLAWLPPWFSTGHRHSKYSIEPRRTEKVGASS
jgi:nucleoporin POM152